MPNPALVSPRKHESVTRKLRTTLPRRIRKQMEERMDILTAIYQADVPRFLHALAIAANQCGLLLADNLKAALSTLALLSKQTFESEGFLQDEMAQKLVRFHLSDEHLRLRPEVGLEVKWLK